jgi:glycerate kinase
MRILVAPDSFKGCLTAREVAESIARGIGRDHDVVLLPLADGGEGTVDALLAAGFSPATARAQDARGDDTTRPSPSEATRPSSNSPTRAGSRRFEATCAR